MLEPVGCRLFHVHDQIPECIFAYSIFLVRRRKSLASHSRAILLPISSRPITHDQLNAHSVQFQRNRIIRGGLTCT